MPVLLQAQNPLFLFGGLGTIIAVFFVFLIKKQSRILFFPFIIFMWGVLFFFNTLDFRANLLHIDFIAPGNFSTSYTIANREYPLNVPISSLDEDYLENFRINFRKPPILNQDDFILSNIQTGDDGVDAVWQWTGDAKFIQILTTDFLHIYDPLLDVYYPDEFTALLLVDRLEFSLLDISSGPQPITTRLALEDLYYRSQPTQISFNSPFKQLIIKSDDTFFQTNYEVWVNQFKLNWEWSSEGWHKFSFADPVQLIEKLEIIEKSPTGPKTLLTMQPAFSTIYAIEENPDPIVIENITLKKFFGRVNLTFPFFAWRAPEILTDFTAGEANLINENGFIHLQPEGIETTLTFNRPAGRILAQGLANQAHIRWWGNIIITISLLLAFILVSLFLKHYSQSIINNSRNCYAWMKKTLAKRPDEIRINAITPFQLLFFSVIIFSWVILLSNPGNPFLLLVLFILSGCSTYFVLKDHIISKK